MTGCSGGGGTAAPATPTLSLAHTSRMESLPKNGARIFIDNVLVDTVTYATDGAAQHDFGNGKTVVDMVPKLPTATKKTDVCHVLVDPVAAVNYAKAVTAYNQATAALYLAIGTIAATTVITSGLGALVLAGTGMFAVYTWESARNDMYVDRALMGGTMIC